ncbi:MAG: 2-dehydro-3-deoxy-6-phosphogalactonate aldolase [Erythrobacter sp.]|nr:MAG: 2-dehydro-3-deoxy-6-phosphogalactonate aldolase [Erythrobacter sp.]
MADLDSLLVAGAPPIIAILRGLVPAEALGVGRALVDAGVRMLEVPSNSPDWQDSVAVLAREFGQDCAIGGGTITSLELADMLHAAGGTLLVAPNCDPAVIARGLAHGIEVLPGVFSPSEAFAAVNAGARRLKLFPAGSVALSHIGALASVLPQGTGIWAVGGVDADNAAQWIAAGAEGVGVGGSLFAPGRPIEELTRRARDLVAAVAQGSAQ